MAPETPPVVNLGEVNAGGHVESTDDATFRAKADSNNVGPVYPADAGRRGQQGVVGLRMYVDELGLVSRVEVIRSSGYPLLDAAAQRALRTWHFKPALKDGAPVADTKDINIEFKIDE